jgi:uncharacterized protein
VADSLQADGWAAGLLPTPYWVSYQLETGDAFVTARLTAEARWDGGSATLDLRRPHGGSERRGEEE